MNRRKEIQEILSNWQQLVHGLQYEPEDYYKALEDQIASKEVEGITTQRVILSQGAVFSRKREYLRVMYGEYIFDICGAPFGSKAFFFSYWMGYKDLSGCFGMIVRLLLIIPFLGALVSKTLAPLTYYQRDTASMFNSLISGVIMEEVDKIVGESGIEPISEEDRVPNDKKLTEI